MRRGAEAGAALPHSVYHGGGISLMRRGRCRIPGCECDGFMDMIPTIDEELA